MGSIESPAFFTQLRPVILMAQFCDLAYVEEGRQLGSLMNACRERNVPTLAHHEEKAIFTYTKFLATHQLNFPFSGMETEILYQIEQIWGLVISPDDIKLTIPSRDQQSILLPTDMNVDEALSRYRPAWNRSH